MFRVENMPHPHYNSLSLQKHVIPSCLLAKPSLNFRKTKQLFQEAEIAIKDTKFQKQLIWIIFYKGGAVSGHERTWRICIRNAFSHFISPTHVNDRHYLHDRSVCCTAILWSYTGIEGVSPDLLPSYPTAQTYISPVSQFSVLQMPLARSTLFHFSPFSLLPLLLFSSLCSPFCDRYEILIYNSSKCFIPLSLLGCQKKQRQILLWLQLLRLADTFWLPPYPDFFISLNHHC